MKKSLEHLPEFKRNDLARAVSLIREMCDDVEMIILFGSHARGDYRDDEDLPSDRKSGAPSDYDILTVCRNKETVKNTSLWRKISDTCNFNIPDMPFRIIGHDIAYLKKRLKEIHYFFSDIVREGRMLYDSGKYRLNINKELTNEQKLEVAAEHFKHWFKRAKSFYTGHMDATRHKDNIKAVFDLHQAAESSYKAFLLVFTNYCPHSHYLNEADKQLHEILPDMEEIFPRQTQTEKDRFELFDYAYIGARYDKDFKIAKKDLDYLSKRVKLLLKLTEKLCREKIQALKKSASSLKSVGRISSN